MTAPKAGGLDTAVTVLNEALATADELVEVLEQELDALKRRDVDALASLAERKHRLTLSLKALDERRQLDGDRGLDLAPAASLSQRLNARLSQAKHLNAINGRVIESSSRFLRRTVDLLLGRNPEEALYGASGERQSLRKNRYTSVA